VVVLGRTQEPSAFTPYPHAWDVVDVFVKGAAIALVARAAMMKETVNCMVMDCLSECVLTRKSLMLITEYRKRIYQIDQS